MPTWNQYLERSRDALDEADRPIPAQSPHPGRGRRLRRPSAAGASILALGVNAVAAGVAATTFMLYVFVYTPLKPRTTLNTAIGAVPGPCPR